MDFVDFLLDAVGTAQYFTLDLIGRIPKLSHSAAHGSRKGRNPLRTKQQQIDQKDEYNFRSAHGVKGTNSAKGN